MAGLYIHIPFCKSRCIYCGFYSTTAVELRQRYVEAVCREVGDWRFEVGGLRFEVGDWRFEVGDWRFGTIYLGGGTPSQLTGEQLHRLFETIYIYNKVEKDAEVTIEVNPDDVTENFAQELSSLPVNRVSMGVQTFSDERLQFLHRRHSADQVMTAFDRLRKAGIENISIDLMYGFPGETMTDWKADIDQALALGAEHLSAYCLMIEEGTPLHRMVMRDDALNASLPDEELERQMYYTLIDQLEAAGYEHYEISNFAKSGCHSRHNSNYWNQTPYIGLGAAAHSYDGKACRRWNTADIMQYMEAMEQGRPCYEEELLDEDTRYNDMVTVALRTRQGLDLTTLSEKHRTYCLQNAQRFIDDQLIVCTDNRLHLTRQGLFVSDMVMSELMMV